MNKRVCWVSIIALLAGLLLPGLLYAGETTTTPATVKMTVIKPGKADRCQTDFIVENIDRELPVVFALHHLVGGPADQIALFGRQDIGVNRVDG